MSTIFDVPSVQAKIVFDQRLQDLLHTIENNAQSWFSNAYPSAGAILNSADGRAAFRPTMDSTSGSFVDAWSASQVVTSVLPA